VNPPSAENTSGGVLSSKSIGCSVTVTWDFSHYIIRARSIAVAFFRPRALPFRSSATLQIVSNSRVSRLRAESVVSLSRSAVCYISSPLSFRTSFG
jgi:hypothetical protein